MSYLELCGITKVYGEDAAQVVALANVDLSVDAGSLVAVMGASGSGKSTLLTIAGSLEDTTSGEVYIGGRPLSSMSRNGKAQLRRQSIGYVFQDYNLLAGLSAVENVSLPLELDGVSARKAQATAMEAIEDFGLKEDESRFDLHFALVVDAELFRLDSLIRWLDTADGRLKRAAAGVDVPASQSFPLPKARRKVGAPE